MRLSDRPATQSLEPMTRGQSDIVWIKMATLHKKIARLTGQPVKKMGNAQWIGHILKRLHLLDKTEIKRGMDGIPTPSNRSMCWI